MSTALLSMGTPKLQPEQLPGEYMTRQETSLPMRLADKRQFFFARLELRG